MNDSKIQTLKTFLLCPCGEKATIGYAFPGSQERGLCDLHEKSVEMRRELSPGRAEVASVRRLDGSPAVVTQHTPAELAAPGTVGDAARELNWERSQNVELKEQLDDMAEELKNSQEQLAEAREALAQAGLAKVDGHPET
jgi:small-conductance mechanosensitive channel